MGTVSLVVLAAGKSMRFGKPKQLEPIGPKGETLLDFTLRDAFASGCDEARLVVREEHEDLFRERFKKNKRVHVVVQSEARGTAHATYVGMEHAAGTSIVANGDDYYGARSMELAVAHARDGFVEENAMVAFELEKTLSPNGPVNRAVCRAGRYHLKGTEEVYGLAMGTGGSIRDRDERTWPKSTLVSMNLWVMRDWFDIALDRYWHDRDPDDRSEFGLPTAVAMAMAEEHQFRVLRTPDRWCGLTYAADAELVRQFFIDHA